MAMLNRRMMLTGLAVAGGGAMVSGCAPAIAASPHPTATDWSDPARRLRTYMLMRGALTDRLNLHWTLGRYYGVIDDKATPVFGVVSGVFARCRPDNAGGYEMAVAEIAFFTDLAEGKPMTEFANPFTGNAVAVKNSGHAPNILRVSPALTFGLKSAPPGLAMKHDVLPIRQVGDDVFLTEQLDTEAAIPNMRPFRYADTAHYQAPRAALDDPAATQVSAVVSYTNVTSWRPWMQMPADAPGHLSCSGIGRTNVALDAMPQSWLDGMAAQHPQYLDNPASILDAVWSA